MQLCKKNIRKLKLPDGSTTCNPEEILLLQKSFYETLYTSKQEVNHDEVAYFMQANVPLLDNGLQRVCDGKVSVEECKKVLKLFSNNKSPGNDGLTIEFYCQFWSLISTPLIQCFNYSYDHGELSHSQKQAIISLLEKEGKDRQYIKNWRPISLLNVDYKILTKTLSNRVKSVLPYIININQTGYVEGRKLCYSVRLVQDIMEYTKIKNNSGILLQIDFEKAFDSIEWNFLIKALKRFNFGDSFIKWVNVIYKNISSCIINNGKCTPYFKVTRSVRQGDPLSGYLFIIALELLAQKIRESPYIQGIFIGNLEYKLTQYVDDLTIFVKDLNSAKEIFSILELYHKAAGLKVNKDKTEGLWLGRTRHSNDKPLNIRWPTDPLKLLGIFLSYDKKKADKANFDDKIEKLKRQLHWWKARDLSIIGRILIVKSIALSKFAHLASAVSIPDHVIKTVNMLLYEFVWKGKRDKVKRDVIIQNYDRGGLNMVDLKMVDLSSKLMWVKEYLDPKVMASWKRNIETFSGISNLGLYLQSSFSLNEMWYLPAYYKESIKHWHEIKYCEENEIGSQLIWYNADLTIGKKPVYNKSFRLWYVVYKGSVQ